MNKLGKYLLLITIMVCGTAFAIATKTPECFGWALLATCVLGFIGILADA